MRIYSLVYAALKRVTSLRASSSHKNACGQHDLVMLQRDDITLPASHLKMRKKEKTQKL